MKDRSPWLLVVALFAALSLVLASCGDDDDAAPSDAGDADVSDEAEKAAEDAAGDVLDSELGGDCAFLGEFAGAGFEENFDPTAALSEADAGLAFSVLADEFEDVAGAAPSEIEDAFATLAEGMRTFADAFEGVDLSDPGSIDPEAMARLEQLGTGPGAEFEAASDEITAWIEANCSPTG